MPHFLNPLISELLQKKQDFSITLVDESGEPVDIKDVVMNLINDLENKQNVSFGSDSGNKVLITDPSGHITIVTGVVMNQTEREKLQRLTDTMILKGVVATVEEVEAIQNPEIGWVYFVGSDSRFLQYCYCETGWEYIGTATMQDTFTARTDNTSVTVGGLKAGSNIYGKTYDEIFEQIMFPYVAPSAFTIAISPSTLNSVLETGTKIIITGVTPKVTTGSKKITSFKLFSDKAHSKLVGETSGTAISGLSLAQSSIYATISDGTTTLSAAWSATLVDPYFHGVLDNKTMPTSAQISKMSKVLVTKGNKTYTYTASDQYCTIAYPATYGSLKSIQDDNGYEYLSDFKSYNLDVVFSNRTIPYIVYVQQKAATINKFAFTFKY